MKGRRVRRPFLRLGGQEQMRVLRLGFASLRMTGFEGRDGFDAAEGIPQGLKPSVLADDLRDPRLKPWGTFGQEQEQRQMQVLRLGFASLRMTGFLGVGMVLTRQKA